jgi:hypothetical protein
VGVKVDPRRIRRQSWAIVAVALVIGVAVIIGLLLAIGWATALLNPS